MENLEKTYDELVDEIFQLASEAFSLEKEAISIAGFKADVGPESSAALLTQVGIPRKGKKKKKNQSLFPSLVKRVDTLIEILEAIKAPELTDDFEEEIRKCGGYSKSHMIENKMGAWRRINGVPCFICDEGMIHAGPKVFIGKKVATLRDELRAERKAKGKKKTKKKKKNAKSKR